MQLLKPGHKGWLILHSSLKWIGYNVRCKPILIKKIRTVCKVPSNKSSVWALTCIGFYLVTFSLHFTVWESKCLLISSQFHMLQHPTCWNRMRAGGYIYEPTAGNAKAWQPLSCLRRRNKQGKKCCQKQLLQIKTTPLSSLLNLYSFISKSLFYFKAAVSSFYGKKRYVFLHICLTLSDS